MIFFNEYQLFSFNFLLRNSYLLYIIHAKTGVQIETKLKDSFNHYFLFEFIQIRYKLQQ